MMRIGMLLLAAGAAAQEPVARLLPELNATMKARAAAVQAKRLDAASSTSTIEQCFVNVCSSDAFRRTSSRARSCERSRRHLRGQGGLLAGVGGRTAAPRWASRDGRPH